MSLRFSKRYLIVVFIMLLFAAPSIDASHLSLDKFIQSFSEKLYEKNQLSLITSLQMGGDLIKEVSLFYSSNNLLNMDQGKALITEIGKSFLTGLNQNAYIKPDLSPYPFPIDQLEIAIFFRGKDDKYAASPKIAQIDLKKGVISFYKYENNSFVMIHQENI